MRSGNKVPFKKMGSEGPFKGLIEKWNEEGRLGSVGEGTDLNVEDALAAESQKASELGVSGNAGQAMGQQMGGGKDMAQRTQNLEKKVGKIVNYLDQGGGTMTEM